MTDSTAIPRTLPEAALAYAALGIRVFRVRRSKAPYANCPRCDRESSIYIQHRPEECRCGVPTCHGFYAATTDPDLIRKWWREEPDANIGAPCKLNGWAVVDIDPRNGGHTSLGAVEQKVGLLPGTVMQITGGDGLHSLYKSPGVPLPGTPFPGIDFKHNGYILLAPSVHKSGGRYQWSGDGRFRHPAVAWPSVLVPRPRPRPVVRPVSNVTGEDGTRDFMAELVQLVMDAAPHSWHGRNNSLYTAACRAHALAQSGLLDLIDAEFALLSAADAVGLSRSEAESTFHSASMRPRRGGSAA